ncbi:MAG TPA: hypothetical protein VGU26_08205 [Gaiellaceae bacterium]|nr:hypothetical protein [Gaiellaceae bacterium]
MAEIDSAEEREPAAPEEEEAERSSDLDWEENEPSPHEGEEQQEVT